MKCSNAHAVYNCAICIDIFRDIVHSINFLVNILSCDTLSHTRQFFPSNSESVDRGSNAVRIHRT